MHCTVASAVDEVEAGVEAEVWPSPSKEKLCVHSRGVQQFLALAGVLWTHMAGLAGIRVNKDTKLFCCTCPHTFSKPSTICVLKNDIRISAETFSDLWGGNNA